MKLLRWRWFPDHDGNVGSELGEPACLLKCKPRRPARVSRPPRLALEKTGWLAQFASNIAVMIREPTPPKQFHGGPYFRDCWIDQRFPKRAFAAAVLLQTLLILFPPPIWTVRSPRVIAPPHELELTWYGPVRDFPLLLPRTLRLRPAPKT